jgi:hypothetical protein
MRDNVEIAKESAEKSKRIEELQGELSMADEIIGSLYRRLITLEMKVMNELKPLVEKFDLDNANA